MMPEILRQEDFAPHVDKAFRFEGWHGTLRLVRIEPLAHVIESIRPPFILIFQGPRNDILPEGIHAASVENGPRFAFHIMPIHTPAGEQQEYQAVFN